jgi:hypothetical protein
VLICEPLELFTLTLRCSIKEVRALYVQPLSKGFDNHKGIVQHFDIGYVTRLIRSGTINWRPGKFFFYNTISREEHKTIYSGFRITEMALYNKIELTAFFSPRQVNLKIRHRILLNPTIQENDLLRLA